MDTHMAPGLIEPGQLVEVQDIAGNCRGLCLSTSIKTAASNVSQSLELERHNWATFDLEESIKRTYEMFQLKDQRQITQEYCRELMFNCISFHGNDSVEDVLPD